jgi:hypothetical protein
MREAEAKKKSRLPACFCMNLKFQKNQMMQAILGLTAMIAMSTTSSPSIFVVPPAPTSLSRKKLEKLTDVFLALFLNPRILILKVHRRCLTVPGALKGW